MNKTNKQKLRGLFSRDWRSVARATKLRIVDQGRPVSRLIAAKSISSKRERGLPPSLPETSLAGQLEASWEV